MSYGSGFTVLIKDGGAYFCQQVSQRPPDRKCRVGRMVLNVFERFGEDGIANKVWRRLGFPPLPAAAGVHIVTSVDPIMPVRFVEPVLPVTRETAPLRLIRFVRPLAISAIPQSYKEEYLGLRLVSEHPADDVGTFEVISQVAITYTHAERDWLY